MRDKLVIIRGAGDLATGVAQSLMLSNLRAMTDRTVLIVTHRPAALQVCDRTIAMVTNREE